jgi:DNA-directed RNA polymerase specialized sigma24 family protein
MTRTCHNRPALVVNVAWQEEQMSDRELEALRRRGFGVAYPKLGSVSEAEDVAQEALLRLTRQEDPIDEPPPG